MSPGRAPSTIDLATCCRTWSPTEWPNVSFTALKWSRSIISAATAGLGFRSSSAHSRRAASSRYCRLYRPVSWIVHGLLVQRGAVEVGDVPEQLPLEAHFHEIEDLLHEGPCLFAQRGSVTELQHGHAGHQT